MDLPKDDSIIITQTGKGKGAVIIKKLDYLQKNESTIFLMTLNSKS